MCIYFFLFLFSIINNPTSQPEIVQKGSKCVFDSGHVLYRKKWAGIAFARFLSREERIACVWPLHTYIASLGDRIDRVQRFQPLGNDSLVPSCIPLQASSTRIIIQTAHGRKIRLLHRGYLDTVEGASKRIKDTLLSTNNTKFKIKQYYSFPLFVEGYFSGMCMIILQQSLVQFSVQSEGEEDIAVSKTLFLFPSIGFREFIFLSLMVAGKCALYDTTRPKRGAAEYRQRIQM